jgi:uncharacterized protein (TIGR00369 family)
LRLRFTRVAENAIRCEFTAAAQFQGAAGVLHGGIQATLLDEVMGTTAHTAYVDHVSASLATAEFSLRYRRPVPVEAPIAICAELRRVDGRNHFIDGRIENALGDVLTVAEARWCRLDRSE